VPDHIPVRRRAALIAALVASFLLPAVLASPADARPDRFERALLRELNAVRAQHGLRPVRHRGRLARVASRHSGELLRTGRMSHVALDGRNASQRLRRFTRGPVGEVIAWSSRRRTSGRAIVHQWLNSPSHRVVLLDGRFGGVGIGARRGRRGLMVTADFARR
jgi:uncharacterized protein YkwD